MVQPYTARLEGHYRPSHAERQYQRFTEGFKEGAFEWPALMESLKQQRLTTQFMPLEKQQDLLTKQTEMLSKMLANELSAGQMQYKIGEAEAKYLKDMSDALIQNLVANKAAGMPLYNGRSKSKMGGNASVRPMDESDERLKVHDIKNKLYEMYLSGKIDLGGENRPSGPILNQQDLNQGMRNHPELPPLEGMSDIEFNPRTGNIQQHDELINHQGEIVNSNTVLSPQGIEFEEIESAKLPAKVAKQLMTPEEEKELDFRKEINKEEAEKYRDFKKSISDKSAAASEALQKLRSAMMHYKEAQKKPISGTGGIGQHLTAVDLFNLFPEADKAKRDIEELVLLLENYYGTGEGQKSNLRLEQQKAGKLSIGMAEKPFMDFAGSLENMLIKSQKYNELANRIDSISKDKKIMTPGVLQGVFNTFSEEFPVTGDRKKDKFNLELMQFFSKPKVIEDLKKGEYSGNIYDYLDEKDFSKLKKLYKKMVEENNG